jgi:GTPase SAR1 family protein
MLIADYDKERQLFHNLLAETCQQQILLFRGPSGCGKTTLINACLHSLTGQGRDTLHVPIQLRGTAVSVAEIFYRLGGRVGWDRLSRFVDQVAAWQEVPNVAVRDNRMLGQNQINVALQVANQVERAERRAALTNAWFADLQALSQPLLLVMDTYEQATTEVQEWIDGPLLARAAQAQQVRVLLAGQKVPDANNIEWGHCCQTCDLYGVHEAKHWLPIVEAMERVIDVRDPEMWLAGICHALDGRPKDIMQVIENLPRRAGGE